MSRGGKKRRAILLGIDGVTFDLLLPWTRNGIMPNLGRAMEMGSYGDLGSTLPPTTPPAWTSCVTGSGPGKHGIFDFRESYLLDPYRQPVSSVSVKAPKIWQLLNAAGRKTGVMNVPVTYPPERVDGFMISGMMTPSQECDYTFPSGLKHEIHSACGDYLIEIDIPRYNVERLDDSLLFFRDITNCFKKRKEVFFHLMDQKEWDFFMVVFTMTDRIQHLFWKYLFPGSELHDQQHAPLIREEIFKCYSLVDDMLGEVLSGLDGGTDLFLVSDHGFGYTEKWFNVDRWLEDTGVLKEWPEAEVMFSGIPTQGLNIINNNTINNNTGGPWAENEFKRYDQLRDRLTEELMNLKDPGSGRELIDRVLYRDEVFEGPFSGLAPDILFVAKDYSVLGRNNPGSQEWLETSEDQANGFHRSNGIFLAVGPHIRKNNPILDADITDVMPTILFTMGEPQPAGLDGRLLEDIFERDFLDTVPAGPEIIDLQRPVQAGDRISVYSREEARTVSERLVGLGYIE